MLSHNKATPEAEGRYQADVDLAAQLNDLLDRARKADDTLRDAETRGADVMEIHRLAKDLDAALTAAVYAAYARERAAIGPRGYEDRIYFRKAKAKPEIRPLIAEAERLLTLRENHRMNRIPEVPRQPAV
jgi:hypothetical protein